MMWVTHQCHIQMYILVEAGTSSWLEPVSAFQDWVIEEITEHLDVVAALASIVAVGPCNGCPVMFHEARGNSQGT